MKFFVPAASTDEEAESVWQATREHLENVLKCKVSERRIFRIAHAPRVEDIEYEVGKPERGSRETVLVILESFDYLVCTATQGVVRGRPIVIKRGTVQRIQDFEP